jgi:hypothetical protein
MTPGGHGTGRRQCGGKDRQGNVRQRNGGKHSLSYSSASHSPASIFLTETGVIKRNGSCKVFGSARPAERLPLICSDLPSHRLARRKSGFATLENRCSSLRLPFCSSQATLLGCWLGPKKSSCSGPRTVECRSRTGWTSCMNHEIQIGKLQKNSAQEAG